MQIICQYMPNNVPKEVAWALFPTTQALLFRTEDQATSYINNNAETEEFAKGDCAKFKEARIKRKSKYGE